MCRLEGREIVGAYSPGECSALIHDRRFARFGTLLTQKLREQVNEGHPEKIRNGRPPLDAMVTRSDAR
jgi:hypothetical protein